MFQRRLLYYDYFWMKRALVLARRALKFNEIPVGAVLVFNNFEIGYGFNCTSLKNDLSSHAEINALKHGVFNCSNKNLFNSTLYVTMEPCFMCKGAIVLFKVKRVVFGVYNRSTWDVNFLYKYRFSYIGGVLMQESLMLLEKFFKHR